MTPETQLTTQQPDTLAQVSAEVAEAVIATGDISKLNSQQRIELYDRTCKSLGLNPLTKPFQYVTLSGKLTLYATKGATEQLCGIYGISTALVETREIAGCIMVKARAFTKTRSSESTGVVTIEGLKGEALANALMKAETKAKRRAVLSLTGLNMLDESEVEDVPVQEVQHVELADADLLNDFELKAEAMVALQLRTHEQLNEAVTWAKTASKDDVAKKMKLWDKEIKANHEKALAEKGGGE